MAKDKARKQSTAKHSIATKARCGDSVHDASLSYYSSAFTLYPHSSSVSIYSIRLPGCFVANSTTHFPATAASASSSSSTARPRCYQFGVFCMLFFSHSCALQPRWFWRLFCFENWLQRMRTHFIFTYSSNRKTTTTKKQRVATMTATAR